MKRMRTVSLVAGACAGALVLAGCADRSSDTGGASTSSGPATAASMPDVNGDGTVLIGVISPGDLDDNGYYEGFVTGAQNVVDTKGWELIKMGSVNPANAAEQARNLCRQGVDMVALAASEMRDAIPVAEEAVCANTVWYTPSSTDLEPTPYITVSRDFVNESMLAAGYANGILMKEAGYTKAGYISGPELNFSVMAATAFAAGIEQLVPEATVISTFTGDFNDSAKAREAAEAQLSQGIDVLYPYLGGATDAVAQVGTERGVLLSTPGTDRCDEPGIDWAVSTVFDPGEYFAAALELFDRGELEMGTTTEWHIGVDPVPYVTLCHGTDEQQAQLDEFMTKIGSGEIVPEDMIAAAAEQ